MDKKIVVTEEMIQAGVDALDPLLGVCSTFFAVREVYIAMERKKSSSVPESIYPSHSETQGDADK